MGVEHGAGDWPIVRSVRRHVLPELGFAHRVSALVHPSARAHVVDLHGAIAEDRLFLPVFPRVGAEQRASVTVVLRGAARVSVGERSWWLGPGDVARVDRRTSLAMRLDGSAGYRGLVVEWATDSKAEPLFGQLNRDELRRASELSEDIVHERLPALLLLRSAARALDVQIRADIERPGNPAWQLVSSALDAALSRLRDGRGLVDVADGLGVGERQARRVVQSLQRAYGWNTSGSWRDALLRRRAMMAALSMTAPGATSEVVSRSLGYASAASLCRALDGLSLPSPGSIARRVKHLT